jgi:hypothetical protein
MRNSTDHAFTSLLTLQAVYTPLTVNENATPGEMSTAAQTFDGWIQAEASGQI